LIDYNQTPFSCDGDEREVLHRVVLRPYEERFIRDNLCLLITAEEKVRSSSILPGTVESIGGSIEGGKKP
jgi:hypothetical protein